MNKVSKLAIHLAGKDAKLCKNHLHQASLILERTVGALAAELEKQPNAELEYRHDQAAALLKQINQTIDAADGLDHEALITYGGKPAAKEVTA